MRFAVAAGLSLWLCSGLCGAGSLSYCQSPGEPDAGVQDRLIQVAALVKNELERSGQHLAIVSRSGLALQRLDQRYSHAGISLRSSANAPWSVRQLYYACDEKRPRIFDQGLTGFVLGAHDISENYISIVLLPITAAQPLERAALDDAHALQLLGGTYSANAYAFSQRYQNCNQWVVELMASAWAAPRDDEGQQNTPLPASAPRAHAQQWLRSQSYQPSVLKVGWQPLMWLAAMLPWLHSDDHPDEDLAQAQFQVSMPQSIEAFVQARLPQATRIELCHTSDHVVLRRGWEPIAPGCEPNVGDDVILLRN